ncbi:AsmA-like C-terminal region-containing protein [Flavobacterium sp. N3904]|uniref:AsmA-like C-terminal region-containing protein n=1 Tax=Flavobacterium sp. N3904 TaxID=2986835 RepID=UPI0022244986|nr:AsmA-like C-terminal region-containing protein [Flavobacterium sp. N3904]
MNDNLQSVPFFKKGMVKKMVKWIVFFIIGILLLLMLSTACLYYYFSHHKAKIITEINQKIDENIKGTVTIGDIGYKLFTGFPNFAVTLNNVVVKDSLWAQHKHTLLLAKEVEVHINLKTLYDQDEVDIEKIQINDATVNIFKEKNGYTNLDIFKPKPKDTITKKKFKTVLEEFALDNVAIVANNEMTDKLFSFDVSSLESKLNYTPDGIQTDLYVNTFAKSLSFKISKGSFIKDKRVKGMLAVVYSKSKNNISIDTKNLEIGEDDFDITAHFDLGKINPMFGIFIKTDILWSDATRLLDSHIFKILNHYNITKPIAVTCSIKGSLVAKGNPEIIVKAIIKNNTLETPDGEVTDCSFHGEYTNNFKNGLGYVDENSSVILTNFSGNYDEIPIVIPNAMIHNLTVPSATGVFKSQFNVSKLNQFVNENFVVFSDGDATVNLNFNVNIVNLKLNKPTFSGSVLVKGATINYKPKDITLADTDIQLNFTDEALTIQKIKYTNGNNTIMMDGKIANFLNLYYNDPAKMVVNWDIYSPNFDAQQFLAMLTTNKSAKVVVKDTTTNLVSNKLQSMLKKCQVVINAKADKMSYNHLLATDVKLSILLNDNQLFIQNGWIQSSGGNIAFDAQLIPTNTAYNFSANATINMVDIPQFLTSFNNFGIKSFSPSNLKGNLSAKTKMSGAMTKTGDLIDSSLDGSVNYSITNGVLSNFEPIMKVGRFAFPRRNVQNIIFDNLTGQFNVSENKIVIDNFKVNSSVLDFNISGIYSFGKGTNLEMTIPLRNPENDYKITDSIKRARIRERGIVLHLVAIDGPDNKIQIKWDKNWRTEDQ